jgi:hypothetical protein
MFLRHRTFIAPLVFSPRGTREAVRLIAERFANEVGVENVVTVVEHADQGGRFTVVVWFGSAEAERGMASRVYVTTADVREVIKQSPDHAFPVGPIADDSAGR